MITYRPGQPPPDPAKLPDFLRDELAKLQQAARQAQPYVLLQTLHAEPSKVWEGMTVIADGTDWDPDTTGAGGVFTYFGSAWVKLG